MTGRPAAPVPGDAAPLPERFRALATGAASSREAARFIESWRTVDAAFAEAECAAESAAGPCRVRFEDVAERVSRDAPPAPRWRLHQRAAAAVLLVAGVATALFLARRGDDVVTLAAIRPQAAGTAPAAPSPADAAALRAAAAIARLPDGPAPWFSDVDAARDAALATGRALLVFVQHPTCPICEELEAGPLRDAGVRERIGRLAAVRVDAFADEDSPLVEREWPYLAAFSPDGAEIAGLPAPCTAEEIRRLLDDALARWPGGDAPSWARARGLAAALDAAAAAGEDDRLRVEFGLLSAVASAADGGAFASAARGRLAALRGEAAGALARASAIARDDPAAAGRLLDDASLRFDGTPWGADLAAVGAALARTGRFPPLRSSATSAER